MKKPRHPSSSSLKEGLSRDSEFVAATVMRHSSTVREVDPRTAMSLLTVLDQIPKVKADLASG